MAGIVVPDSRCPPSALELGLDLEIYGGVDILEANFFAAALAAGSE
jgi:hypothetical protein